MRDTDIRMYAGTGGTRCRAIHCTGKHTLDNLGIHERGDIMVKKYMSHNLYVEGLKDRSVASLQYNLKDAREARDAMPFGINYGFYADEVHYLAAELRRRQAA